MNHILADYREEHRRRPRPIVHASMDGNILNTMYTTERRDIQYLGHGNFFYNWCGPGFCWSYTYGDNVGFGIHYIYLKKAWS